MAGANSNIQISELDFDSIKGNLREFLRSQDKFKDYDFEGSGLSILLDLLAYNTHYNSYYLNMIANEMFMDTAALRSSVVSHAKLLNYTPHSAVAPTATINMVVSNVYNTSSLSLPKFSRFQSEAIDGINYTFVTNDIMTVPVSSNTATFTDIELVQGEPIFISFVVNLADNPKQVFKLPHDKIDTSTLIVQVQKSSTDSSLETFNSEQNTTEFTPQTRVYFLQESLDGNYEIYFGDGLLGKKLDNGNIVLISYVITQGSSASGANNFVFMDSLNGDAVIYPVTPATMGGEKESTDSIKLQAPKAYSAQGRAVSYEDYITAIQQNKLGFSIDSVSVWGGEDNIPPALGQVFISVKPKDSYRLTDSQKIRLVNDVIKPISVVTVIPTIVDPDYTYLKIMADVVYDQKQTSYTASQINSIVKNVIQTFADNSLNTFNSVFSYADLSVAIQNADASILSNNCKIQVQKKFYPFLGRAKSYNLFYGVPLKRSVYSSGITSNPTFKYYTSGNFIELIDDVYIEEVPFPTSGIEKISIINPGFNYTETPSVVITGDGTGAKAHAIVKNGYIYQIVVDEPGSNYTQAIVTLVNSPTDTSGLNGSAYAVLEGRYGKLRSFYYKDNLKTILNENVGIVDYVDGTITLNDFNPYDVNDPLGQLIFTANPESNIISSTRNRIITVDPFDPAAIIVNVTAK